MFGFLDNFNMQKDEVDGEKSQDKEDKVQQREKGTL